MKTTELTTQVVSLRDQISVYGESQKMLVGRVDQLTSEIIDVDKKYQFERVKPRWGSPLAWTIAAVSTSLLVGYIANDALN